MENHTNSVLVSMSNENGDLRTIFKLLIFILRDRERAQITNKVTNPETASLNLGKQPQMHIFIHILFTQTHSQVFGE